MKSEPIRDPFAIDVAGQYVEVIDTRSALHGRIGVIEFFVGDNVYVTFAGRAWLPATMFFPEQLRAAAAPERSLHRSAASTFMRNLRMSLAKMRL